MNALRQTVSDAKTAAKNVLVYLRKYDVAFQIPKRQGEGFLSNPMNEDAAHLPAMINYRIRTHNGLLIVVTGSIQDDPAEELLGRVIIPVVQCFDSNFGYSIIDQRPTAYPATWGCCCESKGAL